MACALSSAVFALDPEIKFKAPRHLSTAIGASRIEIELKLPGGATVDRLELLLDEKPLVTLTSPPWQANWDAGDGVHGHRIEARLFLQDGTMIKAVVRTSPLRINQYEEVGLVNLYALVHDKSGAYVGDLTKHDFRILENGVPQTISKFTTERKPLRVGIVLDTSLSMSAGKGSKLKNARKAAMEFLDVLEPGDEAMVVTFNDEVEIAQDLTSDKASLANAIMTAESKGGTALYDAIYRASRSLAGFDGRRVMVLLSDGRDEAYAGLQPGSLHTLAEALDQALHSEVMVFSIGLGRNLDRQYIIRWDRNLYGESNLDTDTTLGQILRRIAGATGGRALISVGAGQLRKAFNNVAEDLHHQYSIAYVSTDSSRDGLWREIDVSTIGASHEVVTREGYFAPEPERRSGLSGTD